MLLEAKVADAMEEWIAELVIVTVKPPVVVVGLDLITVLGILEPLTAGNMLNVVQASASSGQTSVRFKFLSRGPVGPDSYLQVTLRFRKLSCRGSLLRYCSSPHRPTNESQDAGVENSDPTNVLLVVAD